jgi:hypothetical protein
MRLTTLLAMTLLFTAGCATEWVHPTKSDQQSQADYEECQAQAGQAATAANYASSRNRLRQSALTSCLREKGWAQQD